MTTLGATEADRAPDFLAGGGEMGARMRALDWSNTPFGPPEAWPPSLRSAVSICLGTKFPIAIYWGSELALLYNDAWSPIPGEKHPWALGRPGREVWPEIWEAIGPLYEQVQATGEGVWQQDQLLPMHRHGYTEECYFNFTFSPIRGQDGKPEGIFNAVVETTFRVTSERRERTLRELAERIAQVRSEDDVFKIAAEISGASAADVPFCLFYRCEADGGSAQLAGIAGLERGGAASPDVIDLKDGAAPWPLASIVASGHAEIVDQLSTRFGFALPSGPWPELVETALMMPITGTSQSGELAGVLIVGISPRRALDEEYRAFFERAAAHIATALANVRAYEEARKRAEALADIDRAKTAFFSNVSHEFRTPLTLMLGPLEESLADADQLLPAERERIEVAHRNGLRLLKLVNSLLDFSRIEAGRVQARYEPTDLAELTAELASNFRSATEKAGLALSVDCPALTEPVYVDRDMWEKIVLNLLSNAFKFTFEGGITIELRHATTAAELKVRDTGTGIPEQELGRLFERFHRVEGARGRSFEGSGIGLALVQELVRLHGGTVRVESKENRGTEFTVSIPLGTAHLPSDRILGDRPVTTTAVRAQAYVEEALRWLPGAPSSAETIERTLAAPEPDTLAGGSGELARILLADDNADMRDYVQRLLRGRHAVEAVADGQAALEAIRRQRPDLVLTDMMMPRLDGFGLLRAIREDAELRDLPVIALSARSGEESRVEGLDAGADDYLVKPFSARELIARVQTALTMARVRRESTEALERLNETLEAQVEERTRERDRIWKFSRDMLGVANASGVWLSINPSWSSTLGWSEAELLGKTSEWMEHPDDRTKTREEVTDLAGGRPTLDFENRFRCKDGSYRWLSWTAVPEDGLLYCVARDVTLDKQRQDALAQAHEALRHSQKMEAVGNLTGGVAHDFNNLLQVIGGNLQLLAKDVAGNEKAEQRLRNALAGVSRGSKLASQLLAFGRRQPLAPRVINLGRFARNMDDMLRRALGDGIEIETVVSGGLWNTLADPFQIENAVLNLAINARDAMGGHGKLTIEAGNASLDDSYADRHNISAGQYVMLAVTDTGCGMPPEVIEQAFEPFFTTKPEGRGTGLGLSMVYGFVKQSNGHIKIYSELGHGTTIRVYLPRVRQAEDIATHIDTGPIVGGTETILVVEDDEEVRSTVVEMLSELGYRVLRASDAQGALAIVESGIPIDILFTDVVMPGPLRSPEMARKTQERLPNIAVLFTSGYTDNAIVHGGRLDDGIDLLSKPYTREELARKVRHVLRNQPQTKLEAHAAGEAKLAGPSKSVNGFAGSVLRVLVVEDDGLIRLSTVDMLSSLGHTVFDAGNAGEALAALAKHPIDVLVTDIGLPGTSGIELALQARNQNSQIQLVFASGRDAVTGFSDHPTLAGAILIVKPYSEADLSKAFEALGS